MSKERLDEEAIASDFATSDWMRRAITETRNMDPVDAVNQVEVLLAICVQRNDDILERNAHLLSGGGVAN
jgi:hypothetical protein